MNWSLYECHCCVGYQSKFTSIPSKPTLSLSGNNVTFIWRYQTSHADKSHFRLLMFGLWTNGDISIPLVSLSKNGSLVCYSDRLAWLGNKTAAVFQLRRVTIQDDGEYGLKLNFEAFTLRDSVKLTVIGKYKRYFLLSLLICILNVEIASTRKKLRVSDEIWTQQVHQTVKLNVSSSVSQLLMICQLSSYFSGGVLPFHDKWSTTPVG